MSRPATHVPALPPIATLTCPTCGHQQTQALTLYKKLMEKEKAAKPARPFISEQTVLVKEVAGRTLN